MKYIGDMHGTYPIPRQPFSFEPQVKSSPLPMQVIVKENVKTRLNFNIENGDNRGQTMPKILDYYNKRHTLGHEEI